MFYLGLAYHFWLQTSFPLCPPEASSDTPPKKIGVRTYQIISRTNFLADSMSAASGWLFAMPPISLNGPAVSKPLQAKLPAILAPDFFSNSTSGALLDSDLWVVTLLSTQSVRNINHQHSSTS